MRPEGGPNRFGKTSRLRLRAVARDDGRGGKASVLEERSFTAPFKVMKPFPLGDGSLQAMVQAASAGMMSGDRQELAVSVGPDASLEVVSQSFEKIHKMDSGEARRRISLAVGPGALLRFSPLPCIPFGGSAFRGELSAELADASSRLAIRECLACGRVASGERFAFRSYRSLITVRRAGRLVFRDNAVYEPELCGPEAMAGMGMFEGFSHSGSLLLFGFADASAEAAREAIRAAIEGSSRGSSEIECGATTTAFGDLVVRLLGPSAERLTELMDRVERAVAR
jgi:urease accessory protein